MAKKETRTPPTHVDPLPETKHALQNLYIAFQAKKNENPNFTTKEWVTQAGLRSPTIAIQLPKKDNMGFDKVLRLCRPLGLKVADLMMEPKEFIATVLKKEPTHFMQSMGKKSLGMLD